MDPVAVITVVFVGIIAALFVIGIRGDDPVLATNALLSLVVVTCPLVLEHGINHLVAVDLAFGAVLPFWLALAGCIHAIGMAGSYESIWWWDHFAHVVSSSLIAALLYATLLVGSEQSTIPMSFGVILLSTILLTLTAGFLWELIELIGRDVAHLIDADPMLVHYGRRDTILDLVFDGIGAILVIGFDLRTFVPLAEQYSEVLPIAIALFGGGLVTGTLLMIYLYHRLGRFFD